MRLLQLRDGGKFNLVEFAGNNIPPYAILSHTWGYDNEEVQYHDIVNNTGESKTGYQKILFCGQQAAKHGLQYCWVDTCCIDKSNSQELTEAINSMFRWYKCAERCYAYLSDVSIHTVNDEGLSRGWKSDFRKSKWFSRGWTLQELIAPKSVEFFSREGERLGDKSSLEDTVHEITGIPTDCLRGGPLSQFHVKERMTWAAKRQTTREEDEAYCLLGIFDIHMPLIYGEGREHASSRLWEQIRKTSHDAWSSLDEEQKRTLLDTLRFDQIDARRMTIKTAHVKTCRWLLKRSEYVDWLNPAMLAEHHGFFWIKGKPGAGKSTLMKFLVAHTHKKLEQSLVISFFFNARGEEIEKSTIGAYRSLLLQLLEQLPTLQCVFDSLGPSAGSIAKGRQWSIETLKELVDQAVKLLGKTSVVCFIDALDECDELEIRDMIQFLEQLCQSTVSGGISFHVCFSSRHYPHITIEKGLELVLEGQEGHNQDIINYLESELKIGKSTMAQQIRHEIYEKSSGVFLWVVLVVRILNQEHDRGRIHALRRRLQEIPRDLHNLFRDMLMRDRNNKEELLLCIQWILFAKQPLSPEQLYYAILSGVEPETLSGWDPDEVTADAMKRFILDSSKGLTELTTSKLPKVQFIHESVKDFLLAGDGLSNIWPHLRSNPRGQSHERLKKCCLTYMDMDIFTPLEVSESQQFTSLHDAPGLRKSAAEMFPFLEYAVQNVLYHADMAEESGIAQGRFVSSFPLRRWVKLDNIFEKHEVRRHRGNASLLYMLAERNMANLIKIHPSILSCLEVEKERYGPPLLAAFATASKEATNIFIQALTSGQQTSSRSQLPCIQYDNTKSLQRPFGRSSTYSKRRGLFSYLAELGEEAIMKLLIDRQKIDVDSKDSIGWTPLFWAANNGHEAVVKLLLNTHKVDAGSGNSNKDTPLLLAAENGHKTVVELLLNTNNVEVNSKNMYGRTPLTSAAEKGHEAVVELLLSTGKVDVNLKNRIGLGPLSLAASGGHKAVVELLLSTDKVDVNSKSNGGHTPLYFAALGEHTAVVELLLRTDGVDVDPKDNGGYTPLSLAAYRGYKAVVELLLSTGQVDVNSKNNNEDTPLLLAARYGNKAVVELLLSIDKVDVDSKNKHGETPLYWAAKNKNQEVVKLLFNTGKVEFTGKVELFSWRIFPDSYIEGGHQN